MKKNQNYVPTTLDRYLNESKSFILKRGYGSRRPVVVGAKGNIRDQVLPFVGESKKVSGRILRKFMSGLNEGKSKPAAINMWIKRNSQYFIAESRGGTTFYKLSKIGQRLVNRMKPIMEQKEHDFVDKKKGYDRPGITSSANEEDEMTDEACDEALVSESEGAGQELKGSTIEKYLHSKKKKMHQKSKWENLLEAKAKAKDDEDDEDDEDDDKIDESSTRKSRISKLLEEIKAKKANKLNEEEDEDEGEEDELTFDDIDLGDEDKEEKGDEDLEDDEEGEVKDVEIAEFILTVDNAEAAIAELEERGITAEITSDEEESDLEDEEESDLEDEEDLDLSDEEEDLDLDDEEEDLDLGLEEADETDEEVSDDLDLDLEGEEDEVEVEDEVEDIDLGDEEDEMEGEKIKVSAEYAEELVKYLEEKGVDVEEMFGGELEIEGGDDEEIDDEEIDDEEIDDEEESVEDDENEEEEEIV